MPGGSLHNNRKYNYIVAGLTPWLSPAATMYGTARGSSVVLPSPLDEKDESKPFKSSTPTTPTPTAPTPTTLTPSQTPTRTVKDYNSATTVQVARRISVTQQFRLAVKKHGQFPALQFKAKHADPFTVVLWDDYFAETMRFAQALVCKKKRVPSSALSTNT